MARTLDSLVKELSARADLIKAARAKTASSTGVPAAPEKDPNEKGSVTPPKDPSAAPAKQNVPESSTNSDTTPVLDPPGAKKILGEEKPASLAAKAAAIAGGIRNIAKNLKGGTKAASDIPNLPPNDKKNDEGEKHTGDTGEKHPTKAGDPDPAVKDTPPAGDGSAKAADNAAGAPKDPTEKKIEMPTGDNKGPVPDAAKNTNETGKGDDNAKKAGTEEWNIDMRAMADKIAHVVMKYEEGRQMVESLMQRDFGAQVAGDLIKAASFMEQQAAELAELEAQGAFEAEEMFKNASAEEKEVLVKLAHVHAAGLDLCKTDAEKRAYAGGADAAAQMGDAGMAGPEVPPEAAEGAEAGGDISDDDIVSVLDQLVQSGQLTPELAAEIMKALSGGGEAPAEGGAPGGAPPTGEPGSDEGKEASTGVPEIDSILKQASEATKIVTLPKTEPAAPKQDPAPAKAA